MGAGDEGTKEFDASDSKLRRLREQGNVPKSPEVNQFFALTIALAMIIMNGPYIWSKLQIMFYALWGAIKLGDIREIGIGFVVKYTVEIFLVLIIPLLLITGFASILGDLLQVGLMFTPSQLGPKFDKLNPTTYFKQLFKIKKVVELIKQIAKLSVLVFVAYKMVNKHLIELLMLTNAESMSAVAHVFKEVLQDFVINATVALLLISFIDFVYQRYQFLQDQRMTRKEMMDEHKQQEGDPHMKSQRKQMARRFTQGQQAQLIPEADFITTNPTKIAVALKYKSGDMTAPIVIAKGSDAWAWQIIQIAKANNIPVIENVPLARALYKLVKLGREVPAELYKAVAEVLLFVYRLRRDADQQNEQVRHNNQINNGIPDSQYHTRGMTSLSSEKTSNKK